MVPFISGLDNDENDVDSHEEKDDCDFYEWEGKDDLSNEPCQIFWTLPSTIRSWFHQSAAYSSSEGNLSFLNNQEYYECKRVYWRNRQYPEERHARCVVL